MNVECISEGREDLKLQDKRRQDITPMEGRGYESKAVVKGSNELSDNRLS